MTNGFKFSRMVSKWKWYNMGAWNSGNINDYFEFRYDDLAWNTSNNGQYNQWGQLMFIMTV